MIRKLAAAAAAACALSGAQATTFDLGVHDAVELSVAAGAGIIFGGGVSFVDFLGFELATLSDLTSTAVSLNQAGAIGITGGKYMVVGAGVDGSLYTADDVLVTPTPFDYDGTTGSSPHVLTLAAGKYAYAVTGTTTDFGGLYALVSTVTPVPEPETLSLMLAGAGLLGFMAKRRRKA